MKNLKEIKILMKKGLELLELFEILLKLKV